MKAFCIGDMAWRRKIDNALQMVKVFPKTQIAGPMF